MRDDNYTTIKVLEKTRRALKKAAGATDIPMLRILGIIERPKHPRYGEVLAAFQQAARELRHSE